MNLISMNANKLATLAGTDAFAGTAQPQGLAPYHVATIPADAKVAPGIPSSQEPSLTDAGPAASYARPEKVARAKQLLLDPNYPPREVLQEIAKVFTENIRFR